MITRPALLISLLLAVHGITSQTVSHIYKTGDLLARISQPDTTFVVNFWATWCKPCVQELPAFDSLQALTKNSKTKIILVSLDFKEDLDTKVNPFLSRHKTAAECALLDEINGNDYIDKISTKWSGAIPATLIKSAGRSELLEKKVHVSELMPYLH